MSGVCLTEVRRVEPDSLTVVYSWTRLYFLFLYQTLDKLGEGGREGKTKMKGTMVFFQGWSEWSARKLSKKKEKKKKKGGGLAVSSWTRHITPSHPLCHLLPRSYSSRFVTNEGHMWPLCIQ